MKRSGNVALVLMGGAAFAATFAAGMTYFAWQKPSHAAGAVAQPAQSCTPQPGTQTCEPARRGFAYYFYPRFTSGWSWGWGNSYEPARRQEAALSNNPRSTASSSTPTRSTVPASGGVERSG